MGGERPEIRIGEAASATMRIMRSVAVALSCLLAVAGSGCGGNDGGGGASLGTMPRTLAVWAGPAGVDQVTAAELERTGVDEIVVRRGTVELAGGVPVVRTEPAPSIAGRIPRAAAFRLILPAEGVDEKTGTILWTALSRELATGPPPAELLLELPALPEGTDALLRRLAALAGLPVVPVLAVDQLGPHAAAAAEAAGSAVVMAYGQTDRWREGAEPVTGLLRTALAPLAAAGVPVRTGIVIVPRTDPPLERWGEALGPLTEPENAEIGDAPGFDRLFTLRKTLTWSGREWKAGQRIAVAWTDAARLDAAIAESSRTTVPPCGGWDIVWLPPPTGESLGIGVDGLVAYFGGRGPEPAPVVRAERRGGSVRIVVENASIFPSAVSRFGNWFELDGGGTALVAEDRGGFDGVSTGTRRGGRFRRTSGGVADAVRFIENELSPGETIRSGRIRVTRRRAPLTLRWQVQLSDGRVVTGSAPVP